MINIFLIGLLSILAGSLLARIMKMYPAYLHYEAEKECYEHLHLEMPKALRKLASPWKFWNHCSSCSSIQPWYGAIPILGVFLKHNCSDCAQGLSWRVLWVEVACIVATSILYYKFGLGYQFWLAVIFTYGLILLFGIDVMYHQLPDLIVISLLWIGLLASPFTSSAWAVKSAFFGYASTWLMAKLYWLIRRKEGMGHGDFKMFAMVGAWVGLWALLSTMLISLVCGAIFGILKAVKTKDAKVEFAFGPWIALAVWPSLFYGAYGLHLLDAIKAYF